MMTYFKFGRNYRTQLILDRSDLRYGFNDRSIEDIDLYCFNIPKQKLNIASTITYFDGNRVLLLKSRYGIADI